MLLVALGGAFSSAAQKEWADGHSPEDPELVGLLRKFNAPNSEQQANRLRVELWAYWEKRLRQVHQNLLHHYSQRPELARKLEEAQRLWTACRDATIESYGLCLKKGKANKAEDGWYRSNMNIMIIDMIETRCRILEELLGTIRENDL